MLRIVSLFVLIGLSLAKHEVYDGFGLYEVSVETPDQIELLNFLSNNLDLDIWSHAIPGHPGTILVSKDKKELFKNELLAAGIKFKVESDNIKELMDMEDKMLAEASRKSKNGSRFGSLPFDTIHTYETVDAFLDGLAEAYPDTVTLVNAGKSFEGRDIKYVKISTTNFEDSSKPVIFLESLLHAREWVTLPSTLYAIHKLVIDVTESDLVNNIDWIILPIANPDGYVFTHEEQRLWRKNRNTSYGNLCSGVDLNRNFDINWSEASSSIVCMETFHGRAPFSESETQIIRDIMEENKDRMKLFFDIHSFGSMILYGYGTGVLPSNALFIHMVGVRMATAIDAVKMSWNRDYIVGNVAMVLYEASGSAKDYAMSVGAPFAYTFELPGYRWGGQTGIGFFVDPDFIEQAGFETWEGIKQGAYYVLETYGKK